MFSVGSLSSRLDPVAFPNRAIRGVRLAHCPCQEVGYLGLAVGRAWEVHGPEGSLRASCSPSRVTLPGCLILWLCQTPQCQCCRQRRPSLPHGRLRLAGRRRRRRRRLPERRCWTPGRSRGRLAGRLDWPPAAPVCHLAGTSPHCRV